MNKKSAHFICCHSTKLGLRLTKILSDEHSYSNIVILKVSYKLAVAPFDGFRLSLHCRGSEYTILS